MDLREKKTRRSIRNAFLELRRKKPLERITIKELAEKAEISKATFYLHYKDIYDLSEQLQNEVIKSIFSGLAHPEYCLTNCAVFTEELFYSFYSQQSLIEILFSGTQSSVLLVRLEDELMECVKKQNPTLSNTEKMILTYTINGAYMVYQKYCKTLPPEEVVSFIGQAAELVQGIK